MPIYRIYSNKRPYYNKRPHPPRFCSLKLFSYNAQNVPFKFQYFLTNFVENWCFKREIWEIKREIWEIKCEIWEINVDKKTYAYFIYLAMAWCFHQEKLNTRIYIYGVCILVFFLYALRGVREDNGRAQLHSIVGKILRKWQIADWKPKCIPE